GTFGSDVELGTGPSPYAVVIADLNADSKSDVVVANGSSSTVAALLGNGDGTYAAKNDFATQGAPRSLAVSDLSGDAHPDLVVANAGSPTVSVLLGIG